MKENRIVKNAVILTIMAVLLSAILGFTNQITKDRIAEQDELKKQKAYTAVFEDASWLLPARKILRLPASPVS